MPKPPPRKHQNTTGKIRKTTIEVDILTGCARCGELHRDLVFKKFKRKPRHGITHWCLCPKTGDPILMADVKRLPKKAVKK